MKLQRPALASLAVLGTLLLTPPALPHGGTYQGPGSTTTPTTTTPTGPADTAPGSTQPSAGGSSGGGSTAPVTGGSSAPAPAPAASSSSSSSGSQPSADLSHWGFWWRFNKEPLLDLRARLARGSALSGLGRYGRPSDRVIEEHVLPVLFEASRDESYDGLRSGALVALGRIRHPGTQRMDTAMRASFTSGSGEVRETAGLGLGLLGDHGAMEHLAELLTGSVSAEDSYGSLVNDRMRAFAAYGIGYLGERSPVQDVKRMAVLHLIDRLGDGDEDLDVRIASLNALGLVDLTWQESMLPGAAASPTRNRRGLVEYLLDLDRSGEEPLLEGHLPVTLGRLLVGAPTQLSERVTTALLDSWSVSQDSTRTVGLMLAFGESELPEGSAVLVRLRAHLVTTARKDRVALARRLALIALARLASRPVGDTGLPDDEACGAFERFLVSFQKSGHRTDRPWIGLAAASYGARLRTLGLGPGPDVLAMLRELIANGGSPDSASTAAFAIGLAEDAASGPFLAEQLEAAASPSLRGFLALAVGLVGHADAKPLLIETLHQVRFSPPDLENTAIGLALLDRAETSLRLRAMLRETKLTSLAGSLAGALGRISDAPSVPELARMYRSEGTSNLTRTYLVVALGLACEEGRLPWFADLAAGINYVAWSPTLYDTAGKGILNLF